MSQDGDRPNLRVLRGELDDAPVSREGDPSPDEAPPDDGRRERRRGEIWPGCPVVALGVQGEVYWYLDIIGQLQGVTNHQGDRISGIFGGRTDLLQDRFPRFSKGGETIGWAQDQARAAMQRACTERGVLDAASKVRGAGAWADADGGLVLHAGDQVLFDGRWRPPGDYGGHVYASRPPSPRPALDPDPEAGDRLFEALRSWNWARPGLDPQLMLGWIGAAMHSGAIDWRPAAWVTGDAGTGKSTLQELVFGVMGGEAGVIASTDATPAGLWQKLRQDALPVALDEMEPSDDGRTSRVKDVITLARQAASGGVTLRGGADHKGLSFKARSCFLFSSIYVPPLLGQDASRLAILELQPLARGAKPPELTRRDFERMGRAIRRQVLEQWPRWRETLEVYRLELGRVGYGQRGADQFGTLLAMADLVLFDSVPGVERAGHWAELLRSEAAASQSEGAADWQRLVRHLFGQEAAPWRGGALHTVGELVRAAAGELDEDLPDPKAARMALARIGMRVQVDDRAPPAERLASARLLVAHEHPGLARLFEASRWAAGAGTTGVWVQSLRRAPGAAAGGSRRFGGTATRCVSVPLQPLLGAEEDDAPPPPSPDFPDDDLEQFQA